MSINTIVIVGAGQAGYQVAASLRQEGFDGAITLVGDEPGVPYQRPPLSKAYLLGKVGVAALRFRPPEYFDEHRIARIQGSVAAIDRDHRQLLLTSGEKLSYEHLVLATGARNRVPSVPGMELDGVFGLRSLADADGLSQRLGHAKRAVVIGAGFIGLEFAAVAAARGISVDVLELGTRPMARAVSTVTSRVFDQAHASWGVRIHYGQSLAAILGADGHVTGVQLASGEALPADLVVYGIGVLPNAELASEAGLAVNNGIVVDTQLLTSDPAISAIGDVVSFPSPWAQQPIRLESVQNAVDQAKTVAARLMGKPASYTALPWFWTDQGELKLQIAGLSDGHDETVVLGSVEQRQISVLCFRAGRLVAVESCNRPADHMAARKLIARHIPLSAAEASAEGFELKAFEAATREAN
ncbi:NAD(P)/FAD-dependent oxidoreductase [Hydrogenophaga sp.]|jgi:3-phenylpropionate/trans-cinnamate dioxygenase ferredoxin reductase subunit|uniref:NAD(P)/FAD-dependent oxidoreductase n=1 Tax=Hydrogenophaga sp. TaxID=1904254 RepID=UPI00286E2471|nr:FAD-dependent oxidoreductase [Hydrogenophaga sp.]